VDFLWSVVYLILVALAAHPLGQALPDSWLRADRFPFRTFAWEKRLYRFLRVARWKNLVTDMSRIRTDMVPKTIQSNSRSQFELLLTETCRAELVHGTEILLGLVAIAICPGWRGILVWSVWTLGANLPFLMIQRYNRPRIMRHLERIVQVVEAGAAEVEAEAERV